MFENIPFYKDEKISIFIDGSNLYSATRALEIDIDYRAMLGCISEKSRLVRSFYYTTLADEQDYSPLRPLLDWLEYNGFLMVTKPIKEYSDNNGRKKIKGNMDIELAVDMMEIAEHVDHILLFSGDGSFRRLVEAVQRKGVRVTVISTLRTSPPMVADELRRQADYFLDLEDLAPHISRKNGVDYEK